MKIATVVVMFRPDAAILRNVLAYGNYLDFVIVADNTDNEDLSCYFSEGNNIEYISMMGNQGVARALNVAAKRATDLGFEWLLMLDQDSILSKEAYLALETHVKICDIAEIGIVSTNQLAGKSELKLETPQDEVADVELLMTSGSTLNLSAYRVCGQFQDSLFIDHIDHEYCLRLQSHGYRTIQCMNIPLDHSHGEVRHTRLFGRHIAFIDHKPFRLYYFVRNGLKVGVTFFWYRPRFIRWVLHQIVKHLIKAVLFQDHKLLRVKMFYWGVTDFCMGRYGVGHATHSNFPS